MYEVLINNFNLSGNLISGWSIVSSHTNHQDAASQMEIYINNNDIDPTDIKVVGPS